MSYYRIKIDLLKNGDTVYTPQRGKLQISGKWVKKTDIIWESISRTYLKTEDEAIKIIDSYKNIEKIKEENEVVLTNYRHL